MLSFIFPILWSRKAVKKLTERMKSQLRSEDESKLRER